MFSVNNCSVYDKWRWLTEAIEWTTRIQKKRSREVNNALETWLLRLITYKGSSYSISTQRRHITHFWTTPRSWYWNARIYINLKRLLSLQNGRWLSAQWLCWCICIQRSASRPCQTRHSQSPTFEALPHHCHRLPQMMPFNWASTQYGCHAWLLSIECQ